MRERRLLQRGARWHFRCSIPVDLRSRFGRREIALSLRTSDIIAARLRVRQASALADRLFQVARMSTATRAQLEAMARRWFCEILDRGELAIIGTPTTTADLAARIEKNGQVVAEADHWL